MQNLKGLLAQSDNAFWLLIQHFFVRGLIAIKFLFAARLLGPELVGVVGIAILALTMVESLSDTGLSQAIVQHKKRIDDQQAGAVWTLQLIRGLVLSALLFAFSVPLSRFFNAPESSHLIALAAVIPLLRNTFNPGIFLLQRERKFKEISFYEVSAAMLDLGCTYLLIYYDFGAASILMGNIASDSLKMIISWAIYRTPIMPNFRWYKIESLTSYGKWVWSSSAITLLLNQADKILVAKFLGATEFGFYQVALRISQMAIAEPGGVLGQYLFPNFSEKQRVSSQQAKKYFIWIIKRSVPVFFALAVILVVFSRPLIVNALGSEWLDALPLLRMMAAPMFVGAIIAIMVAYYRGIGAPRVITEAILIQLIVLIICAPIFLYYFGAIGMAISLAVAGSATVGYMFYKR